MSSHYRLSTKNGSSQNFGHTVLCQSGWLKSHDLSRVVTIHPSGSLPITYTLHKRDGYLDITNYTCDIWLYPAHRYLSSCNINFDSEYSYILFFNNFIQDTAKYD